MQSAPESCPDPPGRGEGGARRTGADHCSSGGGAEVGNYTLCLLKKVERIQCVKRLVKYWNIRKISLMFGQPSLDGQSCLR